MAKHEKFHFQSAPELIAKAKGLGIELPWSDTLDPLFEPAVIDGFRVPNRLAVQPMEGFDSDGDGTPGDLAFRRYGRYAAGGSGMIWFEACSVSADGRSNPHQMMITTKNVHQFKELSGHIRRIAAESYGQDHRPFLVLQLTHSGRYSNPGGEFRPKNFSDNPYLNDRLPLSFPRRREPLDPAPDSPVPESTHPTLPETGRALLSVKVSVNTQSALSPSRMRGRQPATGNPQPAFYSDSDLDIIKAAYIEAIKLAEQAGFDAVDVKACHGYLLHEMLYAFDRTDNRYGGSFENRTRFLRDVLSTPSGIIKAVRLSAFDLIPYPHGFGMNPDGSSEIELSEVEKLIAEFSPVVPLWNITAGVPRHAAHIGRPFDRGVFNAPPPDEHPLVSIARLIQITGELRHAFPGLHFVGSGYSWLRQFYPNVGAGVLSQKKASFIGLGRSSFAYPDSPKDLMLKGKTDPKKVCISCSKCTEFMKLSVPTGCGVRDELYKGSRRKLATASEPEGSA